MTEAKQSNELEQNKHEQPTSHLTRVVVIGFFGGALWSFMGLIAYYFNFTRLSPSLVLTPFAVGDWKDGAMGQILGIVLISIISIAAALLYDTILKNVTSLWAGVLYGAALWALVFYVINPVFSEQTTVANLDRNTIITMLCLYVLYGVFVGYSISYDASETEKQHKLSYSNQ